MLPQRWLLRLPRAQAVRALHTRKPPGRSVLQRRPPPAALPGRPRDSPAQAAGLPSSTTNISNALYEASANEQNTLQTPVHISEDPHGILKENHPATSILANSSIVVQRQLEMMNLLVGFEQANRYVIMDPEGNHIGYLAEQEHGIARAVARQTFRTHRSFTTHVFDKYQREVLRFHRPFSWINSRIRVYDAIGSETAALRGMRSAVAAHGEAAETSPLPLSAMQIIGEAQQQWAPLRRKYNLFLHRDLSALNPDHRAPQLTSGELPLSDTKALQVPEAGKRDVGFAQFAYVDEPFLSWDFSLLSADGRLIGSVNRNFAGLAREIFTDTGVYALRMDAAGLAAEPAHLVSQTGRSAAAAAVAETPGMTLDQRAVMLAAAVSIDFDYFSRHSTAGGGGWWLPIWFPEAGASGASAGAGAGAAGAGVGAAEGAAGAAGVAGAAESGVSAAAGQAARGLGVGEGAIAGAGTMAGYEAMQRARERNQQQQEQTDASPQSQWPDQENDWNQTPQGQGGRPNENEDVWGEDFWGDNKTGEGGPWSSGGGGSGGGGGGDGGGWSDWF